MTNACRLVNDSQPLRGLHEQVAGAERLIAGAIDTVAHARGVRRARAASTVAIRTRVVDGAIDVTLAAQRLTALLGAALHRLTARLRRTALWDAGAEVTDARRTIGGRQAGDTRRNSVAALAVGAL